MATRLAADDIRRASIPASPDVYKDELPTGFKPPEGIDFKLDTANPLLSQAKATLHKIETGELQGQEAYSALLGLHAATLVGSEAQVKQARDAEIAKAGPTATAQVTAQETFWSAFLGDEKAGKQLVSRIFTASDLATMNKIVSKISGQGVASFNGANREPPANQGGKVSDEVFAKMTPGERLNYARQFPQQGSKSGRAA